MGSWTIFSSLSRYLALEMVGYGSSPDPDHLKIEFSNIRGHEMSLWGSRTDPDHLEIQFSNIRGHETSLVRRFGVCLVPKMTGEAQLRPKTNKK